MKRLLIASLLVATSHLAMADEVTVYSSADQATSTTLAAIDQLVADRKYESAYKLLAEETKNPFLVAKRVELATKYFVQSLNHVMFAFKDLAPNETLNGLRSTGKGTYNLYPFDPQEVIGNLLKGGDRSAILFMALGDYFYDVSLRYHGRWTEDDPVVAQKAVDNYKRAIEGGIVTATILSNSADKSFELKDYQTASDLYGRALRLDPTLLNADFNIAYAQLMLGNYDLALSEGQKAIEKYANDPNYRMDAILLCSDAAFYGKKFNVALDYLNRGLDISRQEYRVYQKLGMVYLGMGDLVRAHESLDRLFAFAPTNPAASQMVSKAFVDVNKGKELVAFYQRNLEKYKGRPEAQGNLYFHLGRQYETEGNRAEALNAAKKAKEAFTSAKAYHGDVEAAVEALIGRNS